MTALSRRLIHLTLIPGLAGGAFHQKQPVAGQLSSVPLRIASANADSPLGNRIIHEVNLILGEADDGDSRSPDDRSPYRPPA